MPFTKQKCKNCNNWENVSTKVVFRLTVMIIPQNYESLATHQGDLSGQQIQMEILDHLKRSQRLVMMENQAAATSQ